MKRPVFRILVGFIGISACLVTAWWWLTPQRTISPLSDAPWFGFMEPNTDQTKVASTFTVLGYLPFWNLTKTTLQPELDALAYFSLTIGADGQIVTKDEDGNAEPGYRKITSDEWLVLANEAQQNNTNLELTFTQLNNDDIESFLNSPSATKTFLSELDSALLAFPFNAVHLDIEYLGSPTAEMRSSFVLFVRTVKQHLEQRYSQMPLRVAIYAGAAERYQLWDLPQLEPYVDSFVVMTYDFHHATSPVAGPVAPIYGHSNLWDGDINQYLSTILQQLPPTKVLLGVPFYGYQWQTIEAKPLAATFPRTGSTASYDRVQTLLSSTIQTVTQGWDDQALSPYLTYTDDETNRNYVIYYENEISLGYKIELARQLGLGGIAIWALGYEGERRTLWDSIGQFTKIE